MTFNYTKVAELCEAIRDEVSKAVVGNKDIIDLMMVGILSRGHILLEGVPGLGKTIMVKAISKALDVKFSRIQFTPDMMPSDVIGNKIFNVKVSEFEVKKGPIFTNVLLGDEINRTPPKTQSALLQAMEERMITIDGEDYILEDPFIVFATQNPVEYEGTYPLPEAQLDRFMLKLPVTYPTREESSRILRVFNEGQDILANIMQTVDRNELVKAYEEVKRVNVEDSVLEYINQIIEETRKHHSIRLGASPRAGISLLMAGKAFAALNDRDYVIPDDIKYLAPYVIGHRIILNAEEEIEGTSVSSVIESILTNTKVPR